jgi:Tfp pilus assembly protein PilX
MYGTEMTTTTRSSSPRPSLLPRQEGFTMMVTLAVMLVTSLLLIAAFTAANGEIHLTGADVAAKKAYYAAEAGIADYEYHLTQDGNYLSYCTEPPSPNPALNQFPSTAHRATISPNELTKEPSYEQYAIQLLPAESAPETDRKCDRSHLVESMVEEKTGGPVGTFRIESTGYSGNQARTLVATFRNANFVSYVWYTKYETGDPAIYGKPPAGPENVNYYLECAGFYRVRPEDGGNPRRCIDNYFISGESVNGPMHTEDHVGVCGSPTFGRTASDRIEFGNGGKPEAVGYSNELCGGSPTPKFKGTQILPEEVLSIEPPPGDEELQHIVETGYEYKGKTEIVLTGETMTVTNAGVTTPNVKFPPNGVIYVSGACGEAYSPFGPKPRYSIAEPGTTDAACGNVYVRGKYTGSLTIAAENDIIINGNITTSTGSEGTPTGNALLGLIANNFVRIYHPVTTTYEGHGPELDAAAHKETVKVEAKSAALAKELKIEVKEVGAEYEVVLLNAESKVVVETTKFKEARQLIPLTSPYVVYSKGAKYSEGETEKLRPLAAKGLNETCNKNGAGARETFNATVGKCEYTDTPAECDAHNAAEDLKEPTVYAAMLAVKHAVIVDNFACGLANLGNLNVYGAVAGLFTNGFTGQFSGSSLIHGYGYNANYDNRLQVEEPPHFLNPIQAAWYVQRQTIAPNP